MHHTQYSLLTLIKLAIMMVICIAGCNPGRELVPLSGQVRIDGKPLDQGFVIVVIKDYRPAMGLIGKDGRFTIKTKDKEGCALGEHQVTVRSQKTLKGDAVQFFIPERYENPDQSDLKVKVDGPKNDWIIDLTWKGDTHSGPYIVK
jgi:hypothetical protein